jgi:hypothetical protein
MMQENDVPEIPVNLNRLSGDRHGPVRTQTRDNPQQFRPSHERTSQQTYQNNGYTGRPRPPVIGHRPIT